MRNTYHKGERKNLLGREDITKAQQVLWELGPDSFTSNIRGTDNSNVTENDPGHTFLVFQ